MGDRELELVGGTVGAWCRETDGGAKVKGLFKRGGGGGGMTTRPFR